MRHLLVAASLVVASVAHANGGATAELQLGFTVASQRAALAEAAVEALEERLAAIEELTRGRAGADALEVDRLRESAADLRGRIETLEFGLEALRADFDQYQMDQERRALHAEQRLEALEGLLGVEAPLPPGATPAVETTPGGADDGSESVAADAGPPEGLEDRLALAEARMADGKQAAARVILEQGLSEAPDHPLASEAQYRIAETWFNEGKWREAARNFQVVTDRHPKSPWAPWSMLRIGECFDGMGRASAAQTFYEGVVRNFPGSDAAKEAQGRLDR